jgi:superfamily II RNA helicase
MLYNRSNTLKSLEWVIMDEIHYLNDTEVCRKKSFFFGLE